MAYTAALYLDLSLRAEAPMQYAAAAEAFRYGSSYFAVTMASDQPAFTAFTVDSLGKQRLFDNLALPNADCSRRYVVAQNDSEVTYRATDATSAAEWRFRFSEKGFAALSTGATGPGSRSFTMRFSIESHATLLGHIDDAGGIKLPALLHFPNHGTFRIRASRDVTLRYDASREGDLFIEIVFPDAPPLQTLEYDFEVVTVHPALGSAQTGARYDGFRRDFLSMFQLNPRRRALANNVASDTCAFTVFEYAMMAAVLPPLADGVTAISLVRQTLDRYIGGMKAYGMKGYRDIAAIRYDFLDDFPSLLIAVDACEQAEPDDAWLSRNYSVFRSWAERIVHFDTDGDGLMEYPLSGNSGTWLQPLTVRPANWWDTIGFGHKDAYSNALAYQAFLGMERIAQKTRNTGDAQRYGERAAKIRDVFYSTFHNPDTGVLAGWKSEDGHLHDYYFLFVNGMAVTYGLVTKEQGNALWDRLLAKMTEVGYHRFDLGLPGNLIPVRREDYADDRLRYGGPQKADGSDGFQIYENGGATACYAYYTIKALFDLGRSEEAWKILNPMLESFSLGKFQGRAPNGMTYDWMTWDGEAHGYEGLLVDGYLTLLAAVPSQQQA